MNQINSKKSPKKNTLFLEWVGILIFAIIIAFVIQAFIISSTLVMGTSMVPTLETNDRLFVNRLHTRLGKPKINDIVEFHAPDRNEDYIKRVIGLPGDKIEIRDKRVFRNGEIIADDFEIHGATEITSNINTWTIGDDEVFVLGDNRNNSHDSRDFGPIKMNSIVGIAFFRYYPFNNIGKI